MQVVSMYIYIYIYMWRCPSTIFKFTDMAFCQRKETSGTYLATWLDKMAGPRIECSSRGLQN